MQIITRTVITVLLMLVTFSILNGCERQNGYDLATEKGKSGSINEARIMMLKVADAGNIQAMAWLMQDATAQGLGKPSARRQFVTWAERCADKGNATCAESAGIFYWSGIDGSVNFELAEKWFIKAKASGSGSAGGWIEDVKKRRPAAMSIQKLIA